MKRLGFGKSDLKADQGFAEAALGRRPRRRRCNLLFAENQGARKAAPNPLPSPFGRSSRLVGALGRRGAYVVLAVALGLGCAGCSDGQTVQSPSDVVNEQVTQLPNGGTAEGVDTEARATTDTTAGATTGTVTTADGSGSYEVVDASYVAANGATMKLVDVRTASEYAAGHIPGAVNVEYSSSPCTAATVVEDQAALYAAAGIAPGDVAILYCRTGVRAKAAAEALVQAGYAHLKVYVGSWTDWTSDSSRPVET